MTRLFLDACIVIDLFETKPEQQKVLTDALLGKTPYGSELVSMEARLHARARLIALVSPASRPQSCAGVTSATNSNQPQSTAD